MNDTDFNISETLEAIAPTVKVGRHKEYVAGRICFGMHFFIPPNGDLMYPRKIVEAEARAAQDLDRSTYDFWQAGDDMRPTARAQQPVIEPRVTVEEFLKDNEIHHGGAFWYRFWGGRQDGMAPALPKLSWFYNRALERPSYAEDTASHTFEINIPLTLLDRLNRPQLTQKLFKDLCHILQPNAAMGGLNIAIPPAEILPQNAHEQEVFLPLLKNHPGLMFGDAFDMAYHTRWRMSAINWLTAIRGDLLDLCGGRDAVLDKLTRPGMHTAPYGESGLLIQAGPSPQLGNIDEGISLPHYGDVARALKPARIELQPGEHWVHKMDITPEAALYNDEKLIKSQNDWLSRFDEMV